MLCQKKKKNLHESCRMCRRIVVMKLICSLRHCECDGHTVHKLSQRRLTTNRLAPRESECSRRHSTVSSDWLPRYIKATRLVLEIFKAVPFQAWSGPEGSRNLRFPDFMTTAQDAAKVVSLTHRPPLPPGNTTGTHFC